MTADSLSDKIDWIQTTKRLHGRRPLLIGVPHHVLGENIDEPGSGCSVSARAAERQKQQAGAESRRSGQPCRVAVARIHLLCLAPFDIFDGRLTAHRCGDTGRGCIYSCRFCGEGSAVTGAPTDLANSGGRLYRQLQDAGRREPRFICGPRFRMRRGRRSAQKSVTASRRA